MGNIKEAFKRVKKDINSLNQEVSSLREEIDILRESIRELKQTKQVLQTQQNPVQTSHRQSNNSNYTLNKSLDNSTHPSTDRQKNSTDSTHPSTDNFRFKPLNNQNLRISTGNGGVSTDRQTDRQTDKRQDYMNFRQTDCYPGNYDNSQLEKRDLRENFQQNRQGLPRYNQDTTRQYNTQEQPFYPQQRSLSQPNNQQNNGPQTIFPQNQEMSQERSTMNNALEILNSLDSIKKEVRFKFKKLTDQEMSVFSALYQLGEENEIANYRAVSRRLNLSESSIRDYVGRVMKKGIPIEKKRINNKTIHLKISDDLKKIATLPTILKLRDL